jgi:CelD/BcsL family acetyltransferase involved in cellulose biosynthesis
MYNATPVSYALCRIDSDIITYSSTGYDPQFVRLSPGKVLLYTIIEKLFLEGNFRYFDFGGQEWDYKALHATGSIAYLRVMWFPKTAKNLSFVLAHYMLLLAWRAAARIKHFSVWQTKSATIPTGPRFRGVPANDKTKLGR